jgi:hypothetical protein
LNIIEKRVTITKYKTNCIVCFGKFNTWKQNNDKIRRRDIEYVQIYNAGRG